MRPVATVVEWSVCLSQPRAPQKRLNRSSCQLGCGLGWPKELSLRGRGVQIPQGTGDFWMGASPVVYDSHREDIVLHHICFASFHLWLQVQLPAHCKLQKYPACGRYSRLYSLGGSSNASFSCCHCGDSDSLVCVVRLQLSAADRCTARPKEHGRLLLSLVFIIVL